MMSCGRNDSEEEERTYHIAEIVRTDRWLVLLGYLGSGKSTQARWLAGQLARIKDGQAEVTVQASHVHPHGKPTEVEVLGYARLPILVRITE